MDTDKYSPVSSLYREQGLAGRVGLGERLAVLAIDFQCAFTRGEMSGGTGAELRAVESTKVLLDAARKQQIPILYTFVAYREDLQDAGYLRSKVPGISKLTRGSKNVEIDPLILPKETDWVIEKKMPSAFFGTPLQLYLASLHIDTLVITGICTSGCVRATVVDSCSHGYRTIVPRECVADRSDTVSEANLFDIDTRYADVVPLSEVLHHLEQRAISRASLDDW